MTKLALVVDDSMVIRKMVTATLKQLGFETVEAGNGKDALSVAQGKTLALVITDLNMPVMNGLEFIRELRADASHKFTPIVFLTTENENQIREDARAAGATAWVVKPFHPDKIISVIQRVAA
ncbi:Chemotaxis regulator - transmits chemoreceptor signals to flagelllar motor components CheY [Labilithrix luteola]|uniref:Chemotaxis regulator-transmits chemoreceptor signals to flagelllar motor components CheY n=1 Tax=Labilithrix luteola TaxID=1391654 RepID=A0A0K1PLP9_9BACT|nr:response regulator [Labilithrix luteola]AKU94039.1 Chemotaxis regulator - transmits chemoreceptor signals to flagelllar motor components CheY [Labilithrix luteola]